MGESTEREAKEGIAAMNKKSGIKINPAHAGEFTEKAGRAGM